jgi:predicted esterase
MEELRISFPFEARYQRLGTVSSATRDIVFVLHGHGQLAEHFIKKFKVLENDQTVIYAPEGLSRYYLEGFTGRVGATWMTREDRETDIKNYLIYLNFIYMKEESQWPGNVRVHVIGFSQGAATATRWVLDGIVHVHRLILWSGILPHDMDMEKGKEFLSYTENISVYGTEDPYLTDEKTREMTMLAQKSGANFTYLTFQGKHEIQEELLKTLFTND